jgi:hypothetical protein
MSDSLIEWLSEQAEASGFEFETTYDDHDTIPTMYSILSFRRAMLRTRRLVVDRVLRDKGVTFVTEKNALRDRATIDEDTLYRTDTLHFQYDGPTDD